MKNIFNDYAAAIDNCVEWNATAAITVCMKGMQSPLVKDYGFEHLKPVCDLPEEDRVILDRLIHDHRKAIGKARAESEKCVGFGNVGRVKYQKVQFGKLTRDDIMKYRTLIVA